MTTRLNSPFGAISRRSFLATVAAGATVAALPRQLFAADKPTLVTSIRSLSNPYHAVWKTGAEAFAQSVGLDHVTLVSEGNSEKGIADIKAMLAKTGGNMVLNSATWKGVRSWPWYKHMRSYQRYLTLGFSRRNLRSALICSPFTSGSSDLSHR